LSRIKHDSTLPLRAARACLDVAKLPAAALDAVAFYENPYGKLERILRAILASFPRSRTQFGRAVASQLGDKIWIVDELSEALAIPRDKIRLGDHHLSHAASAFYPTPAARAAVLTIDGVGEDSSTALWRGDEQGLACLERIAFPHSLGLYYAAYTAWLGFAVNEGEYKVMGLAAFGEPRFDEEVARTLRLAADGSFELALDYYAHTHDAELGFSRKLETLLGPRRAPGKPWDFADPSDQRYADVAASMQRRLELAVLGLARRARERTQADALCLAGGVALNAVANARVLREGGFAEVHVHPAAGDAGGALGAALVVARELGDPRPAPLRSAALGLVADVEEAAALASSLGFSAQRVDDVAAEAARSLLRDEVLGWVQGRFEWGPRALGQRSLLALPRDIAARERLNRVVKEREPFRPFAPAVTDVAAPAFFVGAPNTLTPFMTTTCTVTSEGKKILPAACHVDGSARVQTVAPDGALHPLLTALERAGAPPVVLNTSLNLAGEPIVGGAVDALMLFARRPIDALIVGDLVIRRHT
jgi:carbamoyltransferase